MFRFRNKIILLLVAVGVLTVAGFVFAQDLGLTNEFANRAGLGTKPIGQTIAEIVRVFLSVLGIIAVVIILYAGFLWMTAAGEADKIATAKKLLINALIGLAIILSSLAIAQFVISALEKATGSQIGNGTGGPPGGGGLEPDAFTIKGISPQGKLPIRNIVVRVGLSHAPDSATINGNILVIKKSDLSITPMNYSVSNNTIELVPLIGCPPPNSGVFCLEENTAYKVEVKTALKDTGGKNLICGGFAPNCTAEFITGLLVDIAPPQVIITYPDPGQSVPQNGLVNVWASATDDSAVSHIEFFADGAYFDKDFPPASSPSFQGKVFWDTTGVSKGSHNLTAKAYDIDSNSAFSLAVNVVVRAEHCFNSIKDADETAIDCGGADCAICTGGSCNTNGECASGSCQNNTCVDIPLILGVSPLDGAPGTYVTITGKYFGPATSGGTVTFLGGAGAADDKVATFAPCANAWTSTQVVAVVPQGVSVNGPIEIKNSLGSDTTNDARGPVLPNYIISPVLRPGICAVTPSEGKSGTDFNIEGDSFGANQGAGAIKFGDSFALPKIWANKMITAVVPVLQAGDNSVRIIQNNIESNAVNFKILSVTSGTKPLINYVNPDKGPIGEYITLFGSNFGDGIGVVEFLRADGTKALGDVNFSLACAQVDYWHNTSITVKVPDKFFDGSNTSGSATSLRIRRQDNELSNALPFNIMSGAPSPGICGLKPNNGPIGTAVDILGERFGSGGVATFYNNVGAASVWGAEMIKTQVPLGAVSGPVKVVVAGKTSNSVNFSIGDCAKTPGFCTVDEQCCNSSCISKTDICQAGPKEGAYAWRISTGVIPKVPRVIEDCQTGPLAGNPSPSPWDSRPGGNSVCLNAIVNIRLDAKLDPNTIIMNGISGDTLALYKCTETAQGKDPCSIRAKVSFNPQYSGFYSSGIDEDGVQMYPAGGLEKNTQYLVELTTGIKALGVGGAYMEEKPECGTNISYCFRFKTVDNTGLCKVGSLVISPQNFTSNKKELLDYLSSPRAKEDVCLNLDASSYNYNWSSSQTERAMINKSGVDLAGRIKANVAIVETLKETVFGAPVIITSSIPVENVTGLGNLIIDFTDPAVIAKWPLCDTACVNSTIGAEFNTEMDASTIIPANIFVQKCKTENCDGFSGTVAGSITYNSATKTFNFVPAAALAINTFYFVQMDTLAIKSSSGVNLTGANFEKYFVWKFKTRTDATPCTLDKAVVSPGTATLNYIGQKLMLDAEAEGAPDSCSPQGQKLNPYSFGWGWLSTQPATASLLNNGVYNILPLANKGCNEKCLHVGSKANVSVCGNSIKEKGEDCDDGNAISGDSCSNVCLNEGTVAPLCGNNIKEKGEDCDYGDIKSGDGCSDHCLDEGSTAGKSSCGNTFFIGSKGEDCDDGNLVSGDGCSSECLNEGTEPGIASCGNNIPEYALGEDCDDGNITSGDGCSNSCQNEGSVYGGGICGNNIKEKGEDCDDNNVIAGDGCSSNCLNEGSSLNYTPTSLCGNQIQEKGEDQSCDVFASSDSNIDPKQYASAIGKGETKIQATANNVKGEANIKVACVYTTDSQCAVFGPNLGAGTDNCCYLRPQISIIVPAESSVGVCRNTLISFSYNQLMDGNAGNISIDETKSGNCPAGSATSTDGAWCNGAIKATRNAFDDKTLGTTTFNFNILNILKSNTRYRIIASDFKNSKGVTQVQNLNPLTGKEDYHWTFTTGKDICKFEKINFNPNPVIFNKVETRPVLAQAISFNNSKEQIIAPVAGVYDWTWNWMQVNLIDSITLSNINLATVSATSKQKNGNGFLNATANIIKDIYNSSAAKIIIAQVPTTVFLCENPWPKDSLGRMIYFTDPDAAKGIAAPGNNFKTYYCRDTSAGGKLLPYLSIVNATANIGGASDIVRELLFADSVSGDAVGVRVYKNLNHLSPLSWYKFKQFAGAPSSLAVDGYDAIVDGRSTYVNAGNHTDGGANYTNVFVVSYNQGASSDVQNIYKQILDNISFNTNLTNFAQCQASGKNCSNNLDCAAGDMCSADKNKLTRDVKRLANLNDIAETLEVYKTNKASYPQILSGSFLRGMSVSVWPSWQATLGNDLGKGLPQDPINKHAVCPSGYDSITCWNGAEGKYMCPVGSRIYQYKNITQDSYKLNSDFEYNNSAGWSNINSNFVIAGVCADGVVGTSATCGDGVVGGSEDCEKGNVTTESCIVNGKSGFRKLTCGINCMWDGANAGACLAGQCGDGIKQGSEVCDDGQSNGKYGYCNTSCGGLGTFCGDNIKNGLEQCDAGVKNGQYGSGCSWDCKVPGPSCGDKIINGGEVCDGGTGKTKDAVSGLPACGTANGYPTYRARSCSASCAWGAWGDCLPDGSCGNNAKEGTEQCDTGTSGGVGNSCVMDIIKGYACKTAVCGDGYLQTGKEVCDSGSANGVSCVPGYGLTCNYCSNQCTIITKTGGFCGDALKNGPEECDNNDFGGMACGNFLSGAIGDLNCNNCKIDTSGCSYSFPPPPSGGGCSGMLCATVGATQCSGRAAYQTCVQQGNCIIWSPITNCRSGQTCDGGICASPPPLPECFNPCILNGFTCGSYSDNCGGMINCGTCPARQTCERGRCN